MSEELINKFLETQLSVLLGLVVLVGAAAFFLDIRARTREKKSNQITVPEDGGTKTITRDEFIYRIFTFMQRQFEEVTKDKIHMSGRLTDANATTEKLSAAIDRLTDHIESQAETAKANQESTTASLKELTDYLDKRLSEMRISREEARRHMEDAEQRLKKLEEALLKKVSEVTTALSSLTTRIENLTSGNEQMVSGVTQTLEDIRGQLGELLKVLPVPPPDPVPNEPKKEELP